MTLVSWLPVHLKKAPPTRRLLKKEISLDSYTWLKRYGSKNGGSQQHHNQMAAHAQQMSVSPSATVESVLMKLSRRNSFCNVPESAETWRKSHLLCKFQEMHPIQYIICVSIRFYLNVLTLFRFTRQSLAAWFSNAIYQKKQNKKCTYTFQFVFLSHQPDLKRWVDSSLVNELF